MFGPQYRNETGQFDCLGMDGVRMRLASAAHPVPRLGVE